jgi:tetratricopeptide (TPR) repeat protein
MKRSQLIIIAVALLTVAVIYLLPRVVVDKKTDIVEEKSAFKENKNHSTELSDEESSSIAELKSALSKASTADKDKHLNDIARQFLKYNKFDSAAVYFERAALLKGSAQNYLAAGNAYYEALTFAVNAEKASKMAEKARYWLEKATEANPKDIESKAKIALTYVNSEAPMQGILKLRALAEENPDNEFVQYNLGILSYQSNQYDKAVSRFEKVVSINPKSVNGYYYLALSQKEVGKKAEAIKNFKMAAQLDTSEEIQTSVNEQLAELENN